MSEKDLDVDPNPLVEQLLEKSKSGKVSWQPTADRRAFVASIGGDTTFKVLMFEYTDVDAFGEQGTFSEPRLEMLDEKGKVLWTVVRGRVTGSKLSDLYTVARRVGNKLDDRVSHALESLSKLS